MASETDIADREQPARPFRYERKFTTVRPYGEVLQLIRRNQGHFREIYSERYINNVYFDDRDLSNYYANEDGIQNRLKTRIRWYGNLTGPVPRPTLEIKVKRGWAGEKPSFPLADFHLDADFDVFTARDCFRRSELPLWVRRRVERETPTLINRYARRYFLSADRLCRLTLDRDLRFYRCPKPGAFVPRYCTPRHLLVIELKYPCEEVPAVDLFTRDFGTRLTKFSKYATGILALYQ